MVNFRMLYILTAALSILSAKLSHAGPLFEVIERDDNGHAVHAMVEIPNLIDERFAETPDFRIVQGTDDHALEWSELSAEDLLRAGNLLHHLTRAKHYFIDTLHSENVRGLEQLLIRINITQGFNSLGHFDNIALDPKYNNAYTVPAGHGLQVVRADPNDPSSPLLERKPIEWKREIFFTPPKNISKKELLNRLTSDPLDPTIHQARGVVYPTVVNSVSKSTTSYAFSDSGNYTSSDYVDALTRQAGTVALIEGSFVLMKEINRWLMPDNYYLDTAMVPEIIYHEFSHVALSDALVPNHPTPVVEGMADYFASVIADSPKLAQKIKEFSTGQGKNGSKPKDFAVNYERIDQSTSDYVLSLLWGIRTVLGKDETTQLIWNTRTKLNSYNSDIRTGLMGSLNRECLDSCKDPRADVLILDQYFYGRSLRSKKSP